MVSPHEEAIVLRIEHGAFLVLTREARTASKHSRFYWSQRHLHRRLLSGSVRGAGLGGEAGIDPILLSFLVLEHVGIAELDQPLRGHH